MNKTVSRPTTLYDLNEHVPKQNISEDNDRGKGGEVKMVWTRKQTEEIKKYVGERVMATNLQNKGGKDQKDLLMRRGMM